MLRLFQLTLCVSLLLLSASCGTKPSPTPSIDQVVQLAKCPRVPSEYEVILPPPTFDDEDSWGDVALKYRIWGLAEWKNANSATKWRGDHPGC